MADRGASTRACPFCREEVRADALRCKHCQAALVPERPDHGGTCPFCKEQIKPDAIRCKHCHADLSPGAQLAVGGCAGCGGARRRRRVARLGGGARRGARRAVPRGTRLVDAGRLGSRGVDPVLYADGGLVPGSVCPVVDADEDGIWAFIGETEDDCIYELVVPVSHYGVFPNDDELIDPYS